MKIKIKWISVILRFLKRQFLRKHCLFAKSFLTLLMSFKTGRVEDNNINDDRIKNNSYGSLEINIEENNLEYKKHDSAKYDNLENKNCTSIEDSYNEEFLGEEDKNQVDKCNIEICKTTVSLETLHLCKTIFNTSDVTEGPVYDKTYTSQSEFFNSSKTGRVEDNNISDDSIENNSYGSLEINIEENNLENKNCTSIKDSYNEEFLGEEDEDQVGKCNIEICKMTVFSETLPLCENIPHTSDVTSGLVTVKVPVVLTECSITITVQSSLKLEDAVLEIKHVRKNVYLNQCKLIPNSENEEPNTAILFLAGFITSNIEYSTKEHNDKEVLSGKLKHATGNVPFKCTTRVTFNTLPKFKATTSQDEVEILQTSIEVCNPYEEEITGRDIREQNFRLMEFFNEKVFCELISTEFVESDILENPTNKDCKSPLEQTFNDITENVVLFLTIKLLQNQNVIISK